MILSRRRSRRVVGTKPNLSTCPRRVVDIKHSTTPWHVCLVVHQCFAAYTSFCLVGIAQQTVWQGAMSSTKQQRNACSSVFVTHTSIPLVGVAQQTVWQGGTSSTSKWKKKCLFFSLCHPRLFSSRRCRSTNCMAGSNVIYKQVEKEMPVLQSLSPTPLFLS